MPRTQEQVHRRQRDKRTCETSPSFHAPPVEKSGRQGECFYRRAGRERKEKIENRKSKSENKEQKRGHIENAAHGLLRRTRELPLFIWEHHAGLPEAALDRPAEICFAKERDSLARDSREWDLPERNLRWRDLRQRRRRKRERGGGIPGVQNRRRRYGRRRGRPRVVWCHERRRKSFPNGGREARHLFHHKSGERETRGRRRLLPAKLPRRENRQVFLRDTGVSN